MGEIEGLRAQRNELSSKEHVVSSKGKEIKQKLKRLEPELRKVDQEYNKALRKIPNIPADDVKVGKDESENEVIRKWGDPPTATQFGRAGPRDHLELGETLDVIDVKRAAKVSGTRFGYLKGDAVLLQFALVQLALSVLTDRKIVGEIAKSVGNSSDNPFIPVVPPVIAKSETMKKMDRFDPIDDRYYFEKDDTLFVGSAEHTIGSMHMNEVFTEKELPLRYLGYSTSFRREAGTYGKDTRGILRVHQFDKLEMESFSIPSHGQAEQNLMVGIQEYLMQQLGIPYQVVGICTGDMGKPDYRQIDIETWLPGQGKYRETHTSDYVTDYQSRRLSTKFINNKGEKNLVHMNDATVFAIGRTLIAIMENYQQKDGSIIVPKVLRKWVGKEKIVVRI